VKNQLEIVRIFIYNFNHEVMRKII